MSDRIAIATTTFYRPDSDIDRSRMDLAKQTVREATGLGYSVVVVDGGSPEIFLGELKDLGAHVEPETDRGMGASRRQAIMEASKQRAITMWTEPEKHPLIPQIPLMVEPILQGGADMVIPTRSSLDSYPTSQQHAENFGNSFFYELTGRSLDMWSGPRIFRREHTHFFTGYDGEYGDKWDSIFIPVLDALHAGLRVVPVTVDYEHPTIQRELEEGNVKYTAKRLAQLNNLVPAMQKHWKALHSEGNK